MKFVLAVYGHMHFYYYAIPCMKVNELYTTER